MFRIFIFRDLTPTLLNPPDSSLLMLALPHHVRTLFNISNLRNQEYLPNRIRHTAFPASIRGEMSPLLGSTWVLEYLLPKLPIVPQIRLDRFHPEFLESVQTADLRTFLYASAVTSPGDVTKFVQRFLFLKNATEARTNPVLEIDADDIFELGAAMQQAANLVLTLEHLEERVGFLNLVEPEIAPRVYASQVSTWRFLFC